MVAFDKTRYKNLTTAQKRRYLKRAEKKLEKKFAPLLAMRRIFQAYKDRIDLEKAKL